MAKSSLIRTSITVAVAALCTLWVIMAASCVSQSGTPVSGNTKAADDVSILAVDFNDGTRGPLDLFYGPTDNPADRDERFTVEIRDGKAVFLAPAADPGPRLTGFLEPPRSSYPMEGDLTISWTFPDVSELLSLGKGSGQPMAIAGFYIRGAYDFPNRKGDWQGGLFGDYWFGFATMNGQAQSVIRQGRNPLMSEPFAAQKTVSYRIEKENGTTLRLMANYDNQGWHQVGSDISITLNSNGSPALAMSHLRVLDVSGGAIRVSADDMVWAIKKK